MIMTVFAKKRSTKEGKIFYNYLSTLTTREGEDITCQLKFREDAGNPKPESCPRNISVNKNDANYIRKSVIVTDDDGNQREVTKHTIWISAWSEGPAYEDHSMDIFED